MNLEDAFTTQFEGGVTDCGYFRSHSTDSDNEDSIEEEVHTENGIEKR